MCACFYKMCVLSVFCRCFVLCACAYTVICNCVESLFCKNDLTESPGSLKKFSLKNGGRGGLHLCFGPAVLAKRPFFLLFSWIFYFFIPFSPLRLFDFLCTITIFWAPIAT